MIAAVVIRDIDMKGVLMKRGMKTPEKATARRPRGPEFRLPNPQSRLLGELGRFHWTRATQKDKHRRVQSVQIAC
jgi:hypothetical protein